MLENISKKQTELQIEGSTELEDARQSLLAETKSLQAFSLRRTDLEALMNAVQQLTNQCRAKDVESQLISSLGYPEMHDRDSRIHDAFSKTFEWALQDRSGSVPQHHFLQWLRCGDGVFWVSGKAGSGKSTLMKYLLQVGSYVHASLVSEAFIS